MVATRLLLIAVLMVWAAPLRAEPIRIAYSGVAASGTPVWLVLRKAFRQARPGSRPGRGAQRADPGYGIGLQ